MTADIILYNGKFTTLDRTNPAASAVAIKDGILPRSARMKKCLAMQALRPARSI